MKGICLVSGGLDSTLALIQLLERGNTVLPMFVDYNQWSWEGEFHSIILLEAFLKNKYPNLLDTVKSQIILDSDNPNVGSVWGRGIALVGLAAMYAYTHGDDFDFIALGNHRGDVGPDCKPGSFNEMLNGVLSVATKSKLRLVLPIGTLTTEEIGLELGARNIPFEMMYSCYWYPNCQYKSSNDPYLCPGCRRKVIAMKAAKVPEAKLYPPNGGGTYQSSLAEKIGY